MKTNNEKTADIHVTQSGKTADQNPPKDPNRYDSSTSAKFIRVYRQAGKDEQEFIEGLVEGWSASRMATIQEHAFDFASSHFGLDFLCMQDMEDRWKELAGELNETFRLVILHSDTPIGEFLKTLLRFSSIGLINCLGDILNILEEQIHQEALQIETAESMLKKRPEAFRDAIRTAIEAHPELLAE